MQSYLDLLRHVANNGDPKGDRTGTGTRSIFGYQLRCDLSKGFPILTTKKIHFKSVVYELLWFLKGDTNIHYLNENGVRIWNEWADENGDLGAIYGKQWRSWGGANGRTFDQIRSVIDEIKKNPNSRRLLVSAWNVGELEQMALQPCHAMFQFYVNNGRLSCQLYQRSADIFLGVPFNIASYALLTHMIAQQTNLDVGEFIWTGGDVHLYNNHFEQANEQLSRQPFPLPRLQLNQAADIDSYCFEDIQLINYESHPAIKARVAI